MPSVKFHIGGICVFVQKEGAGAGMFVVCPPHEHAPHKLLFRHNGSPSVEIVEQSIDLRPNLTGGNSKKKMEYLIKASKHGGKGMLKKFVEETTSWPTGRGSRVILGLPKAEPKIPAPWKALKASVRNGSTILENMSIAGILEFEYDVVTPFTIDGKTISSGLVEFEYAPETRTPSNTHYSIGDKLPHPSMHFHLLGKHGISVHTEEPFDVPKPPGGASLKHPMLWIIPVECASAIACHPDDYPCPEG